ncbi:MAG: hypothetical protein NC038_04370 [Paludibacter sp.]|nr:hypothetical protein [Bacteroidales bacterium]MCM1069457.1 hypothetical protein [Prevotella sp.]MCM1353831.1 hypothetical protein [Bacteroides sp.]MCM1442769.1 hypothetical protein [Muribaculum sp.]MCM1481867.1 hypothetical protein [Paludibacter sp.]
MKKRTLSILIVVLCLSGSVNAGSSVTKLLLSMERLQRNGQLLEAMDSAAYILTIDEGNRLASDFMHRHWDNMVRQTAKTLNTLTDEESLEQAAQRCDIYRLLDEIHTHLADVKMPLYGTNGRWVWQPEVLYYAGHYDAERAKTLRLLLRKADDALMSYDADAAREYYRLALSEYLVAEGERKSNLAVMLEQCNDRLKRYARSTRINDALFAWDLSNLSLALDAQQPEVIAQQAMLRQHITELYMQQAQAAQLQGDTIQAREFFLSAEDWKLQ